MVDNLQCSKKHKAGHNHASKFGWTTLKVLHTMTSSSPFTLSGERVVLSFSAYLVVLKVNGALANIMYFRESN